MCAGRSNRLLEFMDNRRGELPEGGDAIRVRQLRLQLAVLPLATDNLQGNGCLRSKVSNQFDLFLGKGLHALSRKSKRSDQLVVSEHRHDEERPLVPFHQSGCERFSRTVEFMFGYVGDVERRLACDEAIIKAAAYH